MNQSKAAATVQIQRYARGFLARRLYSNLLSVKIIREEEERYENEKRKVEEGLKELDFQDDPRILRNYDLPLMMTNRPRKYLEAEKILSARFEGNDTFTNDTFSFDKKAKGNNIGTGTGTLESLLLPEDTSSITNLPSDSYFTCLRTDISISEDTKTKTKSSIVLKDVNESTLLPPKARQGSNSKKDKSGSIIPRLNLLNMPLKPSKVLNFVPMSQRLRKPVIYEFDIFLRAAEAIQKLWKGYKTRRDVGNFHRMRKAATIVQRSYRSYRSKKMKKLKENLKILALYNKKIWGYLKEFDLCTDKFSKCYPHEKVQSYIQRIRSSVESNLKDYLTAHFNSVTFRELTTKRSVETQTSAALEFANNSPIPKSKRVMWQQGPEGINSSHSKFITNSFGNNTEYFLASHESGSYMHQHPLITSRFNINIPIMSNGKENIKPSNTTELGYMSCCCFKDQVIREQAEEIQRLKALLKENKAEHARSDQILKSRLAAQASLAQKQHSSKFKSEISTLKSRMSNLDVEKSGEYNSGMGSFFAESPVGRITSIRRNLSQLDGEDIEFDSTFVN